MCGICGILNLNERRPDAQQVKSDLGRMLDQLEHRGPDGQGTHHAGPAALGHARLSIIDLEGGRQPILNEDESVALVCNGEVYNFQELREELLQKGHRFRTHSDSEVILHLWEEEGPALVHRLRGMFAFVIHDARQRILFGARDHFGQKPLYYRFRDGVFAFASEIKSLQVLPGVSRELDFQALDQFLFYQFVPHPRTMFAEIRQLPPGSCFAIAEGQLEIERWWQPTFAPDESMSLDEHVERTEQAVLDAVQSHLVSDVPVGVFLSGGIDSSLMLAMASHFSDRPLDTYSISFHGTESDEAEFARIAAERFGARHHEFPFDAGNIANCLETVARIFDQPLADSAAMPLLFLSEQAARETKVVLTGDGGDELFGGYRKYRRASEGFAQTAWSRSLATGLFATERLARTGRDRLRLRRLGSRVSMAASPVQRCAYYRNYWEGWDRHRLYGREVRDAVRGRFLAVDPEHSRRSGLHPVNEMLLLDQEHYLPDDLLLKTDHATMAHGLEARAPLLDPRLAEVAAQLPIALKVDPKMTKVVLRRISDKWLPSELATRPKKGFSFPIREWFRGELHGWLRQRLLDESTVVPKYFDGNCVRQMLDEHRDGARNHGGRLYSLLTLELWHREFA